MTTSRRRRERGAVSPGASTARRPSAPTRSGSRSKPSCSRRRARSRRAARSTGSLRSRPRSGGGASSRGRPEIMPRRSRGRRGGGGRLPRPDVGRREPAQGRGDARLRRHRRPRRRRIRPPHTTARSTVVEDEAASSSIRTGSAGRRRPRDARARAARGRAGLETVVVGIGGGGLSPGSSRRSTGARGHRRRARACAGLSRRARGRPSVRVETDTIADGLAPPFAGELPIEICRGRVETVLVTEDEIAEGMRFLYARAKLACEPAARRRPERCSRARSRQGRSVAVIVSGGNVEPAQAAAILGGQ